MDLRNPIKLHGQLFPDRHERKAILTARNTTHRGVSSSTLLVLNNGSLNNMACLAQELLLRLRDQSPAVLRGPHLGIQIRQCSTASQSQSSSPGSVGQQAPRWIPTLSGETWQRVDQYWRLAKTPEPLKQVAEAAGQGRLFRVIGIHSNNIWLRFGGVLVAVGCAGATYTVYKGAQNIYSAVLGVSENSWATNAIVRTETLVTVCLCVLYSCISKARTMDSSVSQDMNQAG